MWQKLNHNIEKGNKYQIRYEITCKNFSSKGHEKLLRASVNFHVKAFMFRLSHEIVQIFFLENIVKNIVIQIRNN